MKLHPRTMAVAQASADIGMTLIALQREHGLTDIEMMQALTAWQERKLKYMLRAERHPDDPDRPAEQE
jgi:hypothetical protein